MTGAEAPVVLAEAVRFDLAPAEGAEPYRIFLRRSPGPPPASGWPVLYLLDGNAVFATACDAIRVQAAWPLGTGIRDAVVVAVGYPTDAAYDSVRRSWDYGPPPGATYPPHREGGPAVRTGGADHFLAFLDGIVRPEIARRVPVDPARQAIFGHSFGGLCVLHALFTRPGMFTHWIAASPAIWWEDAVVLTAAGAYAARTERPAAEVLITAAAYEQSLAPFQVGAADEAKRRADYAASRVVDNARAMSERLGALPEVRSRFALVEGETHMSILPVAVNQALRFALGTWE
ncbi:alpha/beta hydrolase [Methylobacterium sp. JK268]